MKIGSLEIYSNGNLACKFYSDSGIIDLPKQSSCGVYLSSSQSIPASTWTKIQYDTEDYDVQNEFDNQTNYRFTVTKSGKYLITGSCQLTGFSDGKVFQLSIYKNGTEYKRGLKLHSGVAYGVGASFSAVIKCDSGDYIEIFVYHTDTVSRSLSSGRTLCNLSIIKLG